MAAVTQNATPKYNTRGRYKSVFYNISGADNDTLDVPTNNVVAVNFVYSSPTSATLTDYSVTSKGPGLGSSIAFNSSGAFANAVVEVIGT